MHMQLEQGVVLRWQCIRTEVFCLEVFLMRMSAKKNSKAPSTMNCKHEPGKELNASSEVVLTIT